MARTIRACRGPAPRAPRGAQAHTDTSRVVPIEALRREALLERRVPPRPVDLGWGLLEIGRALVRVLEALGRLVLIVAGWLALFLAIPAAVLWWVFS